MARAPEFRIAGIPVRVEPVFLVIILVLGLPPESPLLLATWVVIAAASVLLHELGHAVAFRAYGLTPRIVLHGLGGITSAEGALGVPARIVTTLAGPLSALVLFGLPALYLDRSGAITGHDASAIVAQVVWINIGWSLLNLVPVLPLDGGQVMLAVLDGASRDRGRRAAEVVSIGVAGILALVAVRSGLLFAGMLAGFLAMLNVRSLGDARRDEVADQLDGVVRALLVDDVRSADAALGDLSRRRVPAQVEPRLREVQAWRDLLATAVAPRPSESVGGGPAVAPPTPPSAALLAARALAAGHLDEGAPLAAWVLANEPDAAPKALLALVIARTGTAAAVADELGHLGDAGGRGARLLHDWLVRFGHHVAADEVARRGERDRVTGQGDGPGAPEGYS
jgi:Zn-dependent protease